MFTPGRGVTISNLGWASGKEAAVLAQLLAEFVSV